MFLERVRFCSCSTWSCEATHPDSSLRVARVPQGAESARHRRRTQSGRLHRGGPGPVGTSAEVTHYFTIHLWYSNPYLFVSGLSLILRVICFFDFFKNSNFTNQNSLLFPYLLSISLITDQFRFENSTCHCSCYQFVFRKFHFDVILPNIENIVCFVSVSH